MTPSIQTKPTIVIDEKGNETWALRPVPASDLAWLAKRNSTGVVK